MLYILAGHVFLIGTFVGLWYYMPADGTKPRFAGTRLEPFIIAAFSITALIGIATTALGLVGYVQ